jgi:hypothetical protein
MRLLTLAGIVLAITVVPAQAGWLGHGGPTLPKPVNLNVPRVEHGAPRVTRLNPKYSSPTWGSDWSRRAKRPERPLRPSLR